MAEKAQQKDEQDEVLEAELVVDDTPQKSNTAVVIWLAIFALLLINTGSYFLWFQQQTTVKQLNEKLSQTQQLATQSSERQQTLQDEDKTSNAKLAAIEAGQQELADIIVAVQQNQKLGNAELQWKWAIAELQYLLTVANQRLLLANDVAGAQHALTLTDQRVEAMDDYRLHSLRALLTEEQLALASVASVDIEGMVLQLQSVLNSVDDLKIWMGPEVRAEQDISDVDDAEVAQDWQQALESMWTEVRSLVVIRHKQDGAAAVLVPEQRYFLYQNLRLQLETARFALLADEDVAFKASIKAATDWLEQYFIGDERDAMLSLLRELQQQQIKVALPDISASLTWLKSQGTEQ
jgi:uroporphyrin-III C-methyltransferase